MIQEQETAGEPRFNIRHEDGEVVQCDSCNYPAPTAEFDAGPGAQHPRRMLCDFCCSTMASRHTEYPSADLYANLRAEVWRAAACVYNMLKYPEEPT